MPIVQVNMLEGRTVQQKRAMVAAVTSAIVDSLGAKPESVRVIINELHPEHFAVAGVSAGEVDLKKRNGQGVAADRAAVEA